MLPRFPADIMLCVSQSDCLCTSDVRTVAWSCSLFHPILLGLLKHAAGEVMHDMRSHSISQGFLAQEYIYELISRSSHLSCTCHG